MPTFAKPEDANDPLTVLLLTAVPENEFGNKTLEHLATLLSVSRYSVYKWIKRQRIRPSRVMQVVKIGEGRVKQSDFDPFVYKL